MNHTRTIRLRCNCGLMSANVTEARHAEEVRAEMEKIAESTNHREHGYRVTEERS